MTLRRNGLSRRSSGGPVSPEQLDDLLVVSQAGDWINVRGLGRGRGWLGVGHLWAFPSGFGRGILITTAARWWMRSPPPPAAQSVLLQSGTCTQGSRSPDSPDDIGTEAQSAVECFTRVIRIKDLQLQSRQGAFSEKPKFQKLERHLNRLSGN